MLVTFTENAKEPNFKISELSNTKVKEVLKQLMTNTNISMRDCKNTQKDGIANISPTSGTSWTANIKEIFSTQLDADH